MKGSVTHVVVVVVVVVVRIEGGIKEFEASVFIARERLCSVDYEKCTSQPVMIVTLTRNNIRGTLKID